MDKAMTIGEIENLSENKRPFTTPIYLTWECIIFRVRVSVRVCVRLGLEFGLVLCLGLCL